MARTCSECERLAVNYEHCFLHVRDGDIFDAFAWLREHPAAHLDLRGATIDDTLLKSLLHGLTVPDSSGPIFPRCDFGAAIFTADADFTGAVFRGHARFSTATFAGLASFRRSRFEHHARFRRARFRQATWFSNTTFNGDAVFRGAEFRSGLRCAQATFAGEATFARATIDGEALFERSTFSAPAVFRHARFTGPAIFTGVRLSDRTFFQNTTFEQLANFDRTHFTTVGNFEMTRFFGEARFRWATFTADARFADQDFRGPARFRETHFQRAATFTRARFASSASFNGVRFDGEASFSRTTFARRALFSDTTFAGAARFEEATFETSVHFANATFDDAVALNRARASEDVRCTRARFAKARTVGPLLVGGALILDDTSFGDHVVVTVDARELSARRATFQDGAHVRVARADVVLEDTDFVRRSMLSRLIAGHLPERLATSDERPRLLTLRGAHVAPLAIEDVDLRPCRFSGAHGLASLRIEATCRLTTTPRRVGLIARATIAEERAWRETHTRGLRATWRAKHWSVAEAAPPPDFRDGYGDDPLSPAQIAAIYRSLREARESHKDEAGAGDLYYGEMEMRRLGNGIRPADGDADHHLGEQLVLTAYWLLSGYGVRAVRAFVSLAVVLVSGAALLWWFGFHDPMSYGRSLIFAVESAISVLRPPDEALSAGGQVVQIALRLAGPLLFGLGLLAIRARVKR